MMRVQVQAAAIVKASSTPVGPNHATLWVETTHSEIGIQGLTKQQAEVLAAAFNAALSL
jgi:hypothetical protein